MTYKQMLRINTPSQCWAKDNGACGSGRRRLGRLSIAEYFRTATVGEDLTWIARHLHTANPERQVDYYRAVVGLRYYGRWAAKHARERLLVIFATYNVVIPAELL